MVIVLSVLYGQTTADASMRARLRLMGTSDSQAQDQATEGIRENAAQSDVNDLDYVQQLFGEHYIT
jgi:hypothetical protein